MNTRQKGETSLTFIVSILLMIWGIYSIGSDLAPAKSEDVQALVATAESSQEAKAVLVEFMKKTPNPDVSDLRQIRKKIDNIINTETARKLTGDKSIETPNAREERIYNELEAARDAVRKKSFSQMSIDEVMVYLFDVIFRNWFMFIPGIFAVAGASIILRIRGR